MRKGLKGVAALALAFGLSATAVAQQARAQDGGAVDPLFPALFANPDDIDLNLRYAAAAEGRGEFRKALSTYERVLLLDPGNVAAREGLARMRYILAPNFTNLRFTLGGGYETNPEQLPDSGPTPASAVVLFGAALRDERRIGSLRWRSQLTGRAEFFPDAQDVDNIYLTGDVGPVLQLTPWFNLRPQLIGSFRTLDGRVLYGEIGGGLEVEGLFDGAMQAARLSVGYRFYDDFWVSDNGIVIDLTGRIARPSLLFDRDALIIRPNLRYSGVDNQPNVFVPASFEPGKYIQVGGQIDYGYAFTDSLSAAALFSVYQRWFDGPSTTGAGDRRDTFISPGAAVTVQDVFSAAVDLTLEYRFEHNTSNDATREFDNHRVTARIGVDF